MRAAAAAGVPRRLAVTWSIPDDFGGMTSAMLHRSRTLAAATGEPVDIVTFDPRPGYDLIRARLAERGELTGLVRLRNFYEDLVSRVDGGPVVEVREVHDADGVLVRVEHRRRDGSLAVLDQRPSVPTAPRGARRLTVFDATGHPVEEYPSAWAGYAAWIDRLVAGGPAVAVVDSKSMARFVAGLQRPDLAAVHVVHASHLSGTARPYAPLRESRAPALARMERFDAVVFLTERQRADAVALLDDPGNLAVIGNGRPLPPVGDDDHDRASGAVVAGLTPRKRVDHAIDIASRAARAAGPDAGISLTIVGDGPERARLEQLAADAACEVAFTGYRADGAEVFAEASWMLVTSSSEGSPLVLTEAMARGCVPIAYDVPYGPGDLIHDGVNGFLVPNGDRDGAAAAVGRLMRATPAERSAMRDAARRTAERFDDRVVVAAWLELERAALARASARRAVAAEGAPAVELDRVRLRLRRRRLTLTARLVETSSAADASGSADASRAAAASRAPAIVTLRAAGTTRYVRRRVRPTRAGRVRIRLAPDAAAVLIGHGRIEVSVPHRPRATDAAAVRLHADRRSLLRRVLDRARRRGGRSGAVRAGEPV